MNKRKFWTSISLVLAVALSMNSCCITGLCPVDSTEQYKQNDKMEPTKLDRE